MANAQHVGGEPDIRSIKIIDRKELAMRPEITELEKKSEPQLSFSNRSQCRFKGWRRREVQASLFHTETFRRVQSSLLRRRKD